MIRTEESTHPAQNAGATGASLLHAAPRWFALNSRPLKACLLAFILVVHFLSRQHLVAAMPIQEGWNYPYVYRTSLALLAGHGYQIYRFSDAPESQPVVAFLLGQRDGLSRNEFQRFLHGPDAHPIDFPLPEASISLPMYTGGGELKTPTSPLHTTRVFDIYTTALLWRVFGIRWSVLLTFCALASTAVCLLVFLTARRLGGGFWAGLFAAVLYLASPLENDFAVRALRDVSPLWFAALAFAVFICLVERFRSAPANWAALGLTGLVCTLGCGWRQDAMLLAPFIGASAAILLLVRRKSWRYLLAGAAAFLLGAFLPLAAIRAMCPMPRMSPLVSFHMSYYGEYSRCNLLGLEDTFQVSRDDVETASVAQQYHADHDSSSSPVECYGPVYGSACFGMFREEISQNLYHWTTGLPRFYVRALDACRNHDLPIGGSAFLPPLSRPRWLKPAATWVLEPLSAAGPWLFALGVVVSLLRRGERWRSICLAGFSVFYAGVLFFVLPELKHAGPLVLPLAVIGGVGLAALRGLANPVRLAATAWMERRSFACLAGGAAAVIGSWGLVSAAAYTHSLQCRRELLAAITTLASTGRPAPEALRSPQLFSVTLLPAKGDGSVGYLLRIAAGPGDSFLDCRRLPHERTPGPASALFTHHRLHSDKEQYFFVTCHPGTAFGDVRPFVCTALLDGDARFLSCTRVGLSDWRRLPVGTVFVAGECDPGDPVVGGPTAVTRFYENPDVNWIGLTLDELDRYRMTLPVALFPSNAGADSDRLVDLEVESWRPIPGYSRTEAIADGVRVRTFEAPGSYAVETPLLTAPSDGTYFFRLRYRPEAGKLTLGVLAQDRQSWLAMQTWDDPYAVDAVRALKVNLHAGQVFSFVAANGGGRQGESSVFVLLGLSAWRDVSGD